MEETESRAGQLSRSKSLLQSQVEELKKQLDEEVKVSDGISTTSHEELEPMSELTCRVASSPVQAGGQRQPVLGAAGVRGAEGAAGGGAGEQAGAAEARLQAQQRGDALEGQTRGRRHPARRGAGGDQVGGFNAVNFFPPTPPSPVPRPLDVTRWFKPMCVSKEEAGHQASGGRGGCGSHPSQMFVTGENQAEAAGRGRGAVHGPGEGKDSGRQWNVGTFKVTEYNLVRWIEHLLNIMDLSHVSIW